MEENTSNLFTWMYNGDIRMTGNESILHFDTDKWHGVLSAQTIPKSLNRYSFEAKLTKGEDIATCMIGIQTETSIIVYQNDGYIHDGDSIIDEGESFGINDGFSCHFQKSTIDTSTYQIMFAKNGTKVGVRTPDVKGNRIRLFLGCQSSKEKNDTKEFVIHTNMGSCIYSLDFCKYHSNLHLISFVAIEKK